jgi:hypothetical protein
MNIGKTLFAQIIAFIPCTSFSRIVQRYGGGADVCRLTCSEQFRVMATATASVLTSCIFACKMT